MSLSISVELAFFRPQTFLAYSTTASCIPKHKPRYGMLFSRAYLIVAIFPSMPESPKPPGTIIPSTLSRLDIFSGCFSKSFESIHSISGDTLLFQAACFTASITEIYESESL